MAVRKRGTVAKTQTGRLVLQFDARIKPGVYAKL
jgi:hypothetical protein